MTKFSGWTRRDRNRVIGATLLSATILAGGGFAWSASANEGSTAPLQLAPVANQTGFADLIAKVKPAVVNIAVTEGAEKTSDNAAPQMPFAPQNSPFGEMFRNFMNQPQESAPEHALGSGFVIDPAGYVVTNNHVVKDASNITVTLTDGHAYPAKVIGRDAKTDLAVLKIDAPHPLPYVAFGDSDKERVGDWVIADGNPFGLGGTVTAGIVSAHDRNLGGSYDDYLQIDAPINPGNSGGPLFNQSGHVVGIDTAIYSPNGGSVGIGFAIPSNLAENVVAQLREHGKVERGWLGIAMQPLTPPMAKAVGNPNAQGVIVDQVQANSPAAKANLQQGDVITAFNGQAIKEPNDLARDVANTSNGSNAKLTIWSDGQERVVNVNIGSQPTTQTASREENSPTRPVGMALAPLTPDEKSNLDLTSTVNGVLVAQVTPGSRAAASGVQPDDVVVRIGDQKVTTPAQAAADIQAAERDKKAAVPFLVMRDGATDYLALQLS